MMKVRNQYKYILTDRFGEVEVDVLNESDFEIEWNREDDFKYFFTREMSQEIIFTGEIYHRLKTLESSKFIFDVLNLKIVDDCQGVEKIVFSGDLLLTDGEWDDILCKVAFKIGNANPDKCLKDGENQKINLLTVIQNKVTVKTETFGGGVYEYKQCNVNSGTPVFISSQYGNLVWCGTGDPYLQNWLLLEHKEQESQLLTDVNGNPYSEQRSVWVREIVTLNCPEQVQPDWLLLENNCVLNNTKKYAKKAMLFNQQFVNNYSAPNEFLRHFTANVIGASSGTVVSIDNGMKLNDIIEKFVQTLCPELQVVSDFFQINPENPSVINYVTGEPSFVNNIIVFQKSDVKRPNAANNATKAEWTFEKLIETLNRMFFVMYSVDGNVFRLEHGSWFPRNQGLDLTIEKFRKYVRGKIAYTYDFSKIPKTEMFSFKEGGRDEKWNGELTYVGNGARGKQQEEKIVIEDVVTDIQTVLDNPTPESEIIRDEGFVFAATRYAGGQYYMITETTIDGVRLNNSLSYPQLIRRYGNFERYGTQARLNGNSISFTSVKPFKKGQELTIPLCCDDEFNPIDYVVTELGNGIVEAASWRLKTKILNLSLLYNIYEGEEPSVIAFPSFPIFTQKNTPVTFTVSASVSVGIIESYSIRLPALFGTLINNGNGSFTYTPNLNFVGLDTVFLRAQSNSATIYQDTSFPITVLNDGVVISAEDDVFNVAMNTNFTSTSILANDTSVDGEMNIVTPIVTTANGETVSIDSNGVFIYNPASYGSFVDSFQYTIENGTGVQATATVFIYLFYPSQPIAVEDIFQTEVNNVLSTDGTIGFERLQENDYTLDGGTYIFNVSPELKTTTEGGSVEIFQTGLFTYQPPVNFVGQDSFEYTVYSNNGASIGNVIINVLPIIFVRLTQGPVTEEDVFLNCNGNQVFIGKDKRANYTAEFFSDVNGTIPINVTGLGLRLKLKKEGINGWSGVDYEMTGIMSGTSSVALQDFVFEKPIGTCNHALGTMVYEVTIENFNEII